MEFRFRRYSLNELRRCATAFVHDFKDIDFGRTPRWTEKVLLWFRRRTATRAHCLGRPGNREFLLDQVHATTCDFAAASPPSTRWDAALKGPCKLQLALECEWGSRASRPENTARILDDAWKVALVRATSKVLVFASKGNREAIHESVRQLRSAAGDDAPWLLIDVPWWNKQDRAVHARLLAQ